MDNTTKTIPQLRQQLGLHVKSSKSKAAKGTPKQYYSKSELEDQLHQQLATGFASNSNSTVVVVSEEPVDVTKQVPTSTVKTSETLKNIAATVSSTSELVDQLHQQLASNSNKSTVVASEEPVEILQIPTPTVTTSETLKNIAAIVKLQEFHTQHAAEWMETLTKICATDSCNDPIISAKICLLIKLISSEHVSDGECYICCEPCETTSPCECGSHVHTECLKQFLISSNASRSSTCSICNRAFDEAKKGDTNAKTDTNLKIETRSNSNLKVDPINVTLRQSGAIEMVLMLLTKHAASSNDVAKFGCAAIADMCQSIENEAYACKFGVINVIVLILRQYLHVNPDDNLDNTKLISSAIRALQKVCHLKDNLHELAKQDGIQLLLIVLQTHTSKLQQATGLELDSKTTTCKTTNSSSTNNEDEDEDEDGREGDEDEDDNVYNHYTRIISRSLRLLKKIYNCSSDFQQVMNMEDFIAIGHNANMVLFERMQQLPNNIVSVKEGCRAMLSLSHGKHDEMLVARGAIQTALSAIHMYPKNSFIVSRGIGALAEISGDVGNDFEVAVAKEGVAVILDTLKKYDSDEQNDYEDTARYACQALRNIIPNDEKSRDYMCKNNGIEILMKVLDLYGVTNYRIGKRGCRVLRALFECNSDVKSCVLKNGGRDIMERMHRKWSGEQEVVVVEVEKILSLIN